MSRRHIAFHGRSRTRPPHRVNPSANRYDRYVLLGRASECARVEAALASAREGRSTATAVVGEAGIGKSALLEHATASAGGMSVLSARGFESEGELAFAALTDLLRPIA